MNPANVSAVEPVVEQAAQINPWLPSAPTARIVWVIPPPAGRPHTEIAISPTPKA